VKRNNPFLLLKKRERKVLNTYERDMKMIAQSLLGFGVRSFNIGIRKRLQNLLKNDGEVNQNDPSNLHKLSVVLYKNSLSKIK
jgi:hypothetical protein